MICRISVAMASYNGSKYIEAQLRSLAEQDHLPAELIVCDDGSSDNTLQVIENFSRTAPFPVIIHRNAQNLGYADNFFKAARLCTGEWVAFCDQDDVWLPNRLSDAVEAIAQSPSAIMILQNAYLCREDLSHDRRVFPNTIKPGFHPPASQYGFWVWPGFLKTMRADIFHRIPHENRPKSYFPKDPAMTHDKWTCMIANATGGFVVLDRPAALYRRHENALTGSYRQQYFGGRIAKSLHIGSDHYIYLSHVASEVSAYLQILSRKTDGILSSDLKKSSGEL